MKSKYNWECLTKKPPSCVSNGKLKKIFFNGRDFEKKKKKFALISQGFSSIFEIRKSFLYNGYSVMPKDGSKIALWLIHKAFKHFYFPQMSGVWIIQIAIKKKKKSASKHSLFSDEMFWGEATPLSSQCGHVWHPKFGNSTQWCLQYPRGSGAAHQLVSTDFYL